MSRRATLIGAGAAIVGLNTKPTLAAESVIAEATAPLPKFPFKWWHSYDGEIYQEQFDTKEQALAYLKECGGGMIAECQQGNYDIDVGGWDIIELLNGQNEDKIGEGEFIDCTDEQARDLGKMVSQAIEDWVKKHKIDIGISRIALVDSEK
jgi:hypothetical protein